MYTKTIEYTDYNGGKRKEDFRFNLSEAEVLEMQLSFNGGLDTLINRIIQAQDQPTIIKVFKTLILKSYGIKSDDGRRFIKSEEISNEFAQTEAYNKLFIELATNTKSAIEFVNGISPNKLPETEVAKAMSEALPGSENLETTTNEN